MNLKGKLITSFASVVVGTLIVFGAITYYTFAESTKNSANKIVQLDHIRVVNEITGVYSDKFNKIYQIFASQLPEILQHTSPMLEERWQLEPVAAHEPAMTKIMVYNFRNREIIPLTPGDLDPTILPIINRLSPTDTPQFFMLGKDIYLLGPLAVKDLDVAFLAKIDREDFFTFIKSLLNIDKSILYLTLDDKTIVPPVFRDLDLQTSVVNFNEIPTFTKEQHHISLGDNGQIYRFVENIFGAQLTYLIPNSFFTKNLIALKNRLITAMLIVCWLSLWVILILAHKISQPIKELNQSTKDIIAFDYSKELNIGGRKDEIGELAVNFETMRKKLKDLVTKDQLTHVYNRRFLMHIFELAVLKAIRLGEELCCIMIDIDFFKKVNDTYGHQAGDYILVEMGKLLLEHTRDYDSPARYGGEEFLLVLPETSPRIAWEVSERIRKTMEEKVMVYEGEEIRCTLSLGISALDIHHLNTPDKLIQYADNALYEAKETGRNKTVLSNCGTNE